MKVFSPGSNSSECDPSSPYSPQCWLPKPVHGGEPAESDFQGQAPWEDAASNSQSAAHGSHASHSTSVGSGAGTGGGPRAAAEESSSLTSVGSWRAPQPPARAAAGWAGARAGLEPSCKAVFSPSHSGMHIRGGEQRGMA